jgi:hypothetical protein
LYSSGYQIDKVLVILERSEGSGFSDDSILHFGLPVGVSERHGACHPGAQRRIWISTE